MGRLLARGLRVTINSDDPAYFGGYLVDNFVQCTQDAAGFGVDEVKLVCRNAFEAAFMEASERERYIKELEEYHARFQ